MNPRNSKNLPHALQYFDELPNSAFVRLPTVKALFACSSATVWRNVKKGNLPKPHKLSPRTTCWNVGELKKTLNGFSV
jgi:predicted DNA-binding transcriptional regulator AlpA